MLFILYFLKAIFKLPVTWIRTIIIPLIIIITSNLNRPISS